MQAEHDPIQIYSRRQKGNQSNGELFPWQSPNYPLGTIPHITARSKLLAIFLSSVNQDRGPASMATISRTRATLKKLQGADRVTTSKTSGSVVVTTPRKALLRAYPHTPEARERTLGEVGGRGSDECDHLTTRRIEKPTKNARAE